MPTPPLSPTTTNTHTSGGGSLPATTSAVAGAKLIPLLWNEALFSILMKGGWFIALMRKKKRVSFQIRGMS